MLARFPWWLRIWCLWVVVAVLLGIRSWRATDRFRADPAERPADIAVAISGNGQVLAWEEPREGGGTQLCVYRLATGRVEKLDRGHDGAPLDESSGQPVLDYQGKTLAFASHASNWVAEDRNGLCDVFWRDLESGETLRIVPPEPRSGLSSSYRPALAPDGQRVAFVSYGVPGVNNVRGRNLCLWERSSQQSRVLPTDLVRGNGPVLGPPTFDPNGKRIAFSAFSYDLLPRIQEPIQYEVYLLELERTGQWPPATPGSEDLLGGWWPVARLSTPEGAKAANAHSYEPVLRRDECFFVSQASNFVADDRNLCHDVFVCALWQKRPVRRLSLSPSGAEANGSSFEPAVSADGRYLAFTSYANNLTPGDLNDTSDVFLLDRARKELKCVSAGLPGPSYRPALSADGQTLAFVSGSPQRARQIYLVQNGTRRALP